MSMIEVVIDSVRVSLMSPQRLVVLRETDGERFLPIWVGPYEAEAITMALQEIEVVRPLTHDLLKNVFTTFNARIKRVEIVALRSDIFYGNIVAELDGREIHVDSRPSDAIALAVRTHVPVLVASEVMEAAGMTPEKDVQDQTPGSISPDTKPLSARAGSEDASDRLSIFKDFIDRLDIDKPAADDESKPDPEA
jgi:bifunctional DNase/RNase